MRTLLTIDRVEGIDEIVIAAREDELLPYAELCKTFGLRKPVKVIVGGATRTESVLRAALESSPETEFFAVQDGARPLVTVELIDEVLDAAACYRRWWEGRKYPKTTWTIDPCYDEPLCGSGYRWW